jgi:hypothetical protein
VRSLVLVPRSGLPIFSTFTSNAGSLSLDTSTYSCKTPASSIIIACWHGSNNSSKEIFFAIYTILKALTHLINDLNMKMQIIYYVQISDSGGQLIAGKLGHYLLSCWSIQHWAIIIKVK